jgi:hypothetical protein
MEHVVNCEEYIALSRSFAQESLHWEKYCCEAFTAAERKMALWSEANCGRQAR